MGGHDNAEYRSRYGSEARRLVERLKGQNPARRPDIAIGVDVTLSSQRAAARLASGESVIKWHGRGVSQPLATMPLLLATDRFPHTSTTMVFGELHQPSCQADDVVPKGQRARGGGAGRIEDVDGIICADHQKVVL